MQLHFLLTDDCGEILKRLAFELPEVTDPTRAQEQEAYRASLQARRRAKRDAHADHMRAMRPALRQIAADLQLITGTVANLRHLRDPATPAWERRLEENKQKLARLRRELKP